MSIENGNTHSVSRALGASHGEPARVVVLVQRRLTHYRVPLFQKMRDKLAESNIVLNLLVGEGTEEERQKRDAGHLDWAVKLPTRYFAHGMICWQPFDAHLRGTDLVVVTQENKLIYNHMLLLGRRDFRLAFWGHAANLQARNFKGPAESFKRWTTPRVDWWFSYTQMTTDLILRTGFPQDRITTLNNAVDTSGMRRQLADIKDDEVSAVRQQLGLNDGPTGVFIGSLYVDKRLDFLIKAGREIRKRIPAFKLLIIGDGPLANEVHQAAAREPWIKWVGVKIGREKLTHLLCGDVMLLPAAVNLCILDSFTLGLPLITTDRPGHNPEFAYLKHGINGLMSANGIAAYAAAVIGLLNNPAQRDELRRQCRISAEYYTLENMADRFCGGIVSALAELPDSNGATRQQKLTVSTRNPIDTTQ